MKGRGDLEIRGTLATAYSDIYTAPALAALHALAPLDARRRGLMRIRIDRRTARARARQRIAFLDPAATIGRTNLTVADARAGTFAGSTVPDDLRRQWIQGTGPAAKPRASIDTSIRNVAYALLSGADGWITAAEQVAREINEWAQGFFGRPIISDWRRQLGFTTRIFRARGLHLDDRHIRHREGHGFSASMADAARQRRRALFDGGHGDQRDPSEHPLGVAPQARHLHGRR